MPSGNIEIYFESMKCLKYLIDITVSSVSSDTITIDKSLKNMKIDQVPPIEKKVVQDIDCLNDKTNETALVVYTPPLREKVKQKSQFC